VPVSSAKICSAASVSLVSKDFTLAGSEGPASVSAWCFVASASEASIYTLGVSAIFFGVVLEDFIVSNTSRTLTILFLLGVIAGPFWVFGTSTSVKGLKISDVFVPSALGSSIFFSLRCCSQLVNFLRRCRLFGFGSRRGLTDKLGHYGRFNEAWSVSKDLHLFSLRRRPAWSS
jgi:hypothetical protein